MSFPRQGTVSIDFDLRLEKTGPTSPSTASVTSATSSSFDTALSALASNEEAMGHWEEKIDLDFSTSSDTMSSSSVDLSQHDRESPAVLIQSVFRSWRCCMKLKIRRLEEQLEQTHKGTEYCVKRVADKQKQEMERFKRKLLMVEQRNLRRSEKDLHVTQALVDDFRAENKEIRGQNEAIMKAIEQEMKTHRELRADLLATKKGSTLVAAQMPRLNEEHKAAKNASDLFMERKDEYKQSIDKVMDFIAYEKKVTEKTRKGIFEMLSLIEECSEDKQLAKAIFKMGVENLEKTTKLAKHLKKKAREIEKGIRQERYAQEPASTKTDAPGAYVGEAEQRKSQRSSSRGRTKKISSSSSMAEKASREKTPKKTRQKTPSKNRGKTPTKPRSDTPGRTRSPRTTAV